VGVDAHQHERARAFGHVLPGQVRIAVAAETAGGAERELGRDRGAIVEAVAVEFHAATLPAVRRSAIQTSAWPSSPVPYRKPQWPPCGAISSCEPGASTSAWKPATGITGS